MHNIGLGKVRGVFLEAFLQRGGGEARGGLHLDGRNVMTACDGFFRDEEKIKLCVVE